ncbi:MAG: Crp/Fnr family transcriptional regulator [Alphaproteobacteria bacterium]|nr:Crp/Fnr family transcriptional regulator [Alphaproteobacteria bacterium]
MARLQSQRRTLKNGAELSWQGQTGHRALILHAGWAYTYKLLPDGRQQILNFCVSGDLIGWRSSLFRSSDQACTTITSAVVSEIRPERVRDTLLRWPRLAAAILWSVSQDEAMLVEHLVDVGRRNASERLAHLLLELHERLGVIGLATERGFRCPLTQDHLADALGLSVVHVNRVLRRMRERGLMAYRAGRVHFDDPAGLRQLAGFDEGYLDRAGWAGVVNPLSPPDDPSAI